MNKVVLLLFVLLVPAFVFSQKTAPPSLTDTKHFDPSLSALETGHLPESFRRAGLDNEGGLRLYEQTTRLLAQDGTAEDLFGLGVAISGDTAVVSTDFNDGISSTDPGTGEVFVFVRSGTTWTLQQRLKASDGAKEDRFGSAMAIDGDTLVVGAYGNFIWRGKAYVFVRSGGVWTQQAILLASDGDTSNRFGSTVAVSGNTAVIGAWFAADSTGVRSGGAYVFTRSGTSWVLQQKLTSPGAQVFDAFGSSVAIAGDELVVTCPSCDASSERPNVGTLSVFTRSSGVWTRQQVLTGADTVVGDYFGRSVAVSGNTMVVGASDADVAGHGAQGAAYIFARSGGVWSQLQKLTASNGSTNSTFGYSVAIDGDTIAIGAPSTLYTPNDEGWVYAFRRNGSSWTERSMVGDVHGLSALGNSVGISGGNIIAGAPYADVGTVDRQGLAYIFDNPSIGVTISGRVFARSGRGAYNVPVSITGNDGQVRYALTNPLGYYRFTNVLTEATYTLRAGSKSAAYAPVTTTVTGQLTDLDLVPQP